MSNVIPLFKSACSASPVCAALRGYDFSAHVFNDSTIWVTDQAFGRVHYLGLVRRIDAASFFNKKTVVPASEETPYELALSFFGSLMDEKDFWESL